MKEITLKRKLGEIEFRYHLESLILHRGKCANVLCQSCPINEWCLSNGERYADTGEWLKVKLQHCMDVYQEKYGNTALFELLV